ncbi:MAG TPA: sigma-70 family RNA polymerase sigma factor [Puia sp.]|nr:sigma-70 family RNA polymerase sigma factor [Puia sp.]
MNLSELIREAKQGSAAAQKCLFDRLAGVMRVLCIRYVKSPEAAEEVLLDGFYKFFRGLPAFTYEGEAPLYGWLKKIMVNECLMYLRQKKAFVMVAESEAEQLSSWEEDALDKLSAAEIFQMIVRLPEGYRAVFNLYSIEGWSHKEISAALGISEGTSRSQLSKARSLLQKMFLLNGTEYVKRKNE